jgi:hypothetical protein
MPPLPFRRRYPKDNIKILILLIIIAVLGSGEISSSFAAPRAPVAQSRLAYADIADLVTASPIIISARIKGTKKVKTGPSEEGQSPRDYVLVNAQVDSLIRGQNGVAPLVSFLDSPVDAQARLRKKARVVLFALPTEHANQLRLVSRNAAQAWSAELEATVRAIAAEVLRNDSPPQIVGIGDAFHISGTVAGEGETQIFLKTATRMPISLSILRHPGQSPRWGVSLGEIVDEAAVPPARDTLLWYRLACALPPRLPPESVRTLPLADAEAAQRDYAVVMENLGSCGRTL